ncbi:HNH endonuclease signature motif containing protein [Geodermatophilus amargosae]|uniref:HNH endonuclease signature motif containing protein n=1 Tax=Geodermatophilus amargosae TaxID=1296565 RepID=UPI0034DE4251
MRLDAEEDAALLAGIDAGIERTARRERAAAKREAAERDGAASPVDEPVDDLDEVAPARERTAEHRCAAAVRLAAALPEVDRRAGDPPRREVVVHVDAAVLADAAAGRAHLEGGPPLHATRVRRMPCEATVVTMLPRRREPLPVGRARRFATRAQRWALFRRDGGCARPGCPARRIGRLHAHHLRHWLHGGATDVGNTVLLCDAGHGPAHDLDPGMTRRAGELVAVTPDGRRVWGRVDVASATGADDPGSSPVRHRPDAGDPSSVTRLLFPDRAPDLPGTRAVGGGPMSLAHVVGVLLGNRDLERRLRAENAGGLSAAA